MIGPHLLRQQRRRQIFVDHRFAARQPTLAGDHRDAAAAVAGLLTHLHDKYPFTQFHISRQVYMGVWDALLNEDCHLAIGAAGNESLENSIKVLPLGKIEWVFAIAATHPLAAAADPLNETQLRPYAAINVEDTARHLAKRTAWLLSGQQEIKVPDLRTKLECHLRGLGIGFLPRRLCQTYLESGELVAKQLKYPRQSSPLSLAWSDARGGEAVRTLINLFQTRDPLIAGLIGALD
ncbi:MULTISPECIES: LysR substrate-binding domain-containing protein [Serratia]|uniref:LysR substrate-binding domain-containing protein n=1 Tax=Serratia TaxID=613 RepID=UPI0009B2971F|nr:LysR substrate-binding domain-containing protein [Serratia marcescens]